LRGHQSAREGDLRAPQKDVKLGVQKGKTSRGEKLGKRGGEVTRRQRKKS